MYIFFAWQLNRNQLMLDFELAFWADRVTGPETENSA